MERVLSYVAAFASLLFAGVALFATEYNYASLVQIVLLPVAYWLPVDAKRQITGLCAVQCILFTVCLFIGKALGSDNRTGILISISMGLVADAMFHNEKVAGNTGERASVYMLF